MDYFKKLALRNLTIAIFPWWAEFKENIKFVKYAREWRQQGFRPPFPCLLKRTIIKTEADRFSATVLVETGTFLGDTPWFFRRQFKKIFSIELQPRFAHAAAQRFLHWPHIKIIEGDSATKLAEITPSIDGRCVFWLDGHYSSGTTGRGQNDCPVWGEFDAIIGKVKHPYLILIDDARCFGTSPGYPKLEEIESFVRTKLPDYTFRVENDIIRIIPVA